MKVNAFLTVYNTRTKHISNLDETKIMDIIIDLLKPIKYLPYDDKLKIIDKTINDSKTSTHPTADRYRHFVINLISAYTSIECTLEGFDVLSESRLLDLILSTFESEYKICSSLMQMCMQDVESG